MRTKRQSEGVTERRRERARLPRLLSFSLLLSFGFLLGCADNNARRGGGGGATPNSDPLVGSVLTPPTPVPAATVGQPTPTLTPTPAGGTSAVPPVPVNGSTLSN